MTIPPVAQALSLLFGLHDIRTLTAATPQKGLATLARERVDLVIADMNFSADTTSGEEGAALFRALRAQQPDLPVVLLTAWTHLESAVQLVKAGAADYIGKPWDNDKLLATVENLLELAETTRERQRLQDEQRRRRERLAEQYDLCGIVFASDAMERVVELACRVARADVRVLITGPNGAGKERIAQIVHANSSVRTGPFVAVNCGAIPSELIEAELFGAEAGAFTGATRARTGRFEAANGGTLFLDEIGDLPLAGQVKLLRVLETGQFEMLGSSKTRSAQVRIVSATNADLPALIREGRFREDLYYRLNVIDIAVPAAGGPAGGYSAAGPPFSRAQAAIERGCCGRPAGARLAGQCARAAQFHRTRQAAGARQHRDRGRLESAAAHSRARRAKPSTSAARCWRPALREAGGNISRAAQSLGLSRQALVPPLGAIQSAPARAAPERCAIEP